MACPAEDSGGAAKLEHVGVLLPCGDGHERLEVAVLLNEDDVPGVGLLLFGDALAGKAD